MENRFTFNLDIKQNIINNIRFQQGDLNGSVLEAHLFDNSVVKDITGATVEFRFLKPDGTIVYQNSSIVIDKVTILDAVNGVVECILNPAALSQSGLIKCEINLTSSDGSELTIPYFRLTVNSSIGIDGILSSSYISAVETIKDAYETALHDNVNVELVDARNDNVNNITYSKIGDRLNAQSASLADKAQQISTNTVNISANANNINAQKGRIDNLVATPNTSFYQKSTSGTTGALLVVSSGATTGQINLASVTPVATGYTPVAGDYVLLVYGVASGSAELIDSRVGTDGTIYDTVGNAMRSVANGIGITKKSITQDKFSFCSANRQFIDRSRLISNKAYSGAGTTTTPGSNSYKIMPAFRIEANKSYYFYDVSGTLSFIKWDDASIYQFSTTYGNLAGKITTTQAGTVYITSLSINTAFSDCLLPYYIDVMPALNFNVKNNDEFINVELIKRVGLHNAVTGYVGIASNGASVNSNVITVPSGSTGNNTYTAAVLDKGKIPYKIGDEIFYCVKYTVSGDTLDSNFRTPIAIYVNENTDRFDKFFPYRIVNGNTVEYYSKITIPSGATLTGLRIVLQLMNSTAMVNNTTITINDVSILSLTSSSYYENQINNLIAITPKMNYKTVDINGTGDFTTLRACLESITDSSKTNLYTVYIKPGQYIMQNEYSDLWSNPNFTGLFVPNYVTLVGLGNKEDIVISATSTQGYILPSALNIRAYASLENITVNSSGMRYCVHDDFDDIQDGAVQSFKNCAFIGANNVYGSTFGSGIRSGATWTFENCTFQNCDNNDGFRVHNNVNWTKPANIKFKNCRFKTATNTCSVIFSSLNNNTNNILTYITLEGCKFNGSDKGIYLVEENVATYGAGILYKISGYANAGATYSIQNTDGKDYSGNIDLI